MIRAAALAFLIACGCFALSGMAGSSMDADGMLHEPFFFLIPTGWLFVFIGLITGALAASSSILNTMRAKRP